MHRVNFTLSNVINSTCCYVGITKSNYSIQTSEDKMKKLLTGILVLGSLSSFAAIEEVTVKCSVMNELTKVQDKAEQVLSVDDAVPMDQEEVMFNLEIESPKYGQIQLEGGGSITSIVPGKVTSVATMIKFKIPALDMVIGELDSSMLSGVKGDIANAGSVIAIGGEYYRFGCKIHKK
jgi:hypothetical protein